MTNFHDFKYNPGSAADAFGFGSASRELRSGVPDRVDDSNTEQVDRVTKNGFREDWRVKSRRPLWDQKFNFAINRKFDRENGDRFGLVGALNYSNTNKSFLNMENSRYGIYNGDEDTKNYSYKYTDNQYTNDVKLGAMLNLSYLPAPKDENHINKYEFRNLFNQLGRKPLHQTRRLPEHQRLLRPAKKRSSSTPRAAATPGSSPATTASGTRAWTGMQVTPTRTNASPTAASSSGRKTPATASTSTRSTSRSSHATSSASTSTSPRQPSTSANR